MVKGLRTCSSGQNAPSAANSARSGVTARWTFPLYLLTVARGSFSPEGETNRRSCAVHADNYLRSLPPYCFFNNRPAISISWLSWPGYEPSFFRPRGSSSPPTQLPFEGMWMGIRGYCSRLLQERELIFYYKKSLWKKSCCSHDQQPVYFNITGWGFFSWISDDFSNEI